jgi:hypothetical protein
MEHEADYPCSTTFRQYFNYISGIPVQPAKLPPPTILTMNESDLRNPKLAHWLNFVTRNTSIGKVVRMRGVEL